MPVAGCLRVTCQAVRSRAGRRKILIEVRRESRSLRCHSQACQNQLTARFHGKAAPNTALAAHCLTVDTAYREARCQRSRTPLLNFARALFVSLTGDEGYSESCAQPACCLETLGDRNTCSTSKNEAHKNACLKCLMRLSTIPSAYNLHMGTAWQSNVFF